MVNNLTLKQQKFVKKYLENGGNGTKAALDTYNTNDPEVAKVIASQNLTKLNVQQAIGQVLKAKGLTLESAIGNVSAIANTRPDKIPADVILKANIELLKLHGVYNQPLIERSYSVRLQNKSKKELKEVLIQETTKIDQLLEEFPG